MAEMVRQLLYLAELESHGDAVGESEHADLHAIAIDVISKLAPLAIRDGNQLALTGAEGPILVKGSPEMLGRALRNLIENALGHTPKDTAVEVHLSADGLVRVSDQGQGVPRNKRDAVFQRFWRGDDRTGSGVGLGLSIVKRVVESIGGQFWIEDAPDGGACFVIRLVVANNSVGTVTMMS
jgi:signal transduction histidine kinase